MGLRIENWPLSKDNYIEALGVGTDFLEGRAGNDVLVGNEGRDFLDGGPGHDVLIGNSGHARAPIIGWDTECQTDSFAFADEYCGCCEPTPIYGEGDQGDVYHWRMCDIRVSQGGYGGDVVSGWVYDSSVIQIGRDGRRATIEKDNFVNGTKAQDADDRVIYDQSTGRLWIDPDGEGGKKKLLVATFVDDEGNNPYHKGSIHPDFFYNDIEIPRYMLDV